MINKLKLLLIGATVFQQDNTGKLTAKGLVVDYVQEFSQWFSKVIWATTLSKEKPHTRTIIDENKVVPCILKAKAWGWLADYFKLQHLIDRQTVIFLYLPNVWLVPVVLALRRRAKGFFVYVANDYVQHSERSRKTRGWVYSYLYKLAHELPIRLADGVVVRGKLNFERAKQLNRNVIETVPIGLNTVLYKRTKEPCSGNLIRILYVGKLVEGKGVEVLLQAFSELCRRLRNKQLLLTIVGTGSKEGEIKKMCHDLDITDMVKFLGFVDDKSLLSWLYAEADMLVVVPSTYPEGVPRVINEALLHGTPVIASALEGIQRQFTRGEVFFVRPGNAQDIANVMEQLISDAKFRLKTLKAIALCYKKTGTWKSAAEQHKSFIIQTIEKEDKRRKFYEDAKYVERVHSTSFYRKINNPWLVELLKKRMVLELGCGASPQDHLGRDYIGVDISQKALEKGKGKGKRVQADITLLPFRDNSIDAVLTIAVLEHIPEPERVLQEVVRVLRPGGVAVHQDAWNVPLWRPLGLKIKRYSELSFCHRILKLLLPILESLPVRSLRIIPKRIIREILFVMRRWEFDYKQIKPNYNLPEVSDADACNSIDSHAVLLFYKSNGFKVVKPKDSFLRRLLIRGYIVVQK